mgnify:CR=1 FL=1
MRITSRWEVAVRGAGTLTDGALIRAARDAGADPGQLEGEVGVGASAFPDDHLTVQADVRLVRRAWPEPEIESHEGTSS